MTLKDYLHISEDVFTLSNEFLYITHHYGDEYVLNLKTKQKFHNHIIEDTNKSLATLFNVPLYEFHYQELKHKDHLVYFEKVEPVNHDLDLWAFIATETFVGSECKLQLKYGIQQEQGGKVTFEVLRKEKVNSDLQTYGESANVPQIKITTIAIHAQTIACDLVPVQPIGEPERITFQMDTWEDFEP